MAFSHMVGTFAHQNKCPKLSVKIIFYLSYRTLMLLQIMDHGASIQWDDIAGLQFAKSTIKEIVIYPMLRP